MASAGATTTDNGLRSGGRESESGEGEEDVETHIGLMWVLWRKGKIFGAFYAFSNTEVRNSA